MSEHTPTPWRTDDGWALGVYDVVGPDNKPICMVAHGDIDHDLRILNARFIVKAVNSHEALVKALRESAADIVCSCKNPDDPYIAEALRRIGNVLAAVGGGS